MEVLYVFWTWLQNDIFEIDNPNLPQNATNDAIYEAYNWKDKGLEPLFISIVGIFGLGPFLWFIEWMFSQYWLVCCCLGDRRLYYVDPRLNKARQARREGAGLSGVSSARRMQSLNPGDDGDSDYDEEEEKVEDEPSTKAEKKPKTYRGKLEELAAGKA